MVDTYELIHAEAVEKGKPVPDVIIDFGKAARACGLGEMGLNGKIINKEYGPFMRYCFIITDMPLEFDDVLKESICDRCGACIKACPGNAIDENGLDTWQCSVYYKGAHKSNPFITDEFLKDNPERDAILNGEITYIQDKKYDVLFHGTGDVFACTLLSALMLGFSLEESAKRAIEFVILCIKKTIETVGTKHYGVNFEMCMPCFLKLLEIN